MFKCEPKVLGCLFIFLIGCGSFFGVSQLQPTVYDDDQYLERSFPSNPTSYLVHLCTTPVVNLWHPISVFSHDVLSSFFGTKSSVHHFFNITLHILTTILLAKWLTSFGFSNLLSLSLSAVWALHPITIESTAWISSRKELLLAFFSLLSLVLNKNSKHIVLVYLAVFAACLSKPTAVILPIILMIDYWVKAKSPQSLSKTLHTYGWLIPISIILIIITLYFQGLGAQNVFDNRGILERITQAGWVLSTQFQHIIWPQSLHTAYLATVELSVIFILVLPTLFIVMCVVVYKSKLPSAVRMSLPFFLLFLLPTIGLIRAGNDLVADRYAYLPLIGIILIIPHLVPQKKQQLIPRLLLPICVILTLLTIQQRQHWKSTEAIFSRTLLITSEHSYALAQLGTLYAAQGELNKAERYLAKSILITPTQPLAHVTLGNLAEAKRDFKTSKFHYLQLTGNWGNEAWVYARLAILCWNLQQYDESKSHLNKAESLARTADDKEKIRKLRTKYQYTH